MNIEIVASFEHASGAPMAALRLARGLSDRGHHVNATMIYRKEPIPRADYPFTLLIERDYAGLPNSLDAFRRLRRAFGDRHPDAVISFLPLANVIGQLAAAAAGIPIRMVTPRVPVTTYSRAMRIMDGLLARAGIFTCVVAPTGAVLESCRHYPKSLQDTFSIVNNGLLDWTPSPLSREEARRRFDIPPGVFTMVSVGRLAEQKNFGFLLPVMEQLDGALLLIAGGGELEEALRSEIRKRGLEDRVRLLGPMKRDKIAELLAAGDVFVQPSLFEGQSNALLEGLASGLPCFVGDQPEQRETLTHADGTIAGAVLPLQAAAWVEAVERLKSDPSAADRAREAARHRAADFSFDGMIKGFERALEAAGRRPISAT